MPTLPTPPTLPGSHLFFYLLGGTVALLAGLALWDVLQRKQTLIAEFPMGQPALAPVLAEAARLATLDPARGETAREAAWRLLNFLLHSTSVDLCHPGFGAYREGLERLSPHPDPEIAGPARDRLKEIAGWIEARERDWGKVC